MTTRPKIYLAVTVMLFASVTAVSQSLFNENLDRRLVKRTYNAETGTTRVNVSSPEQRGAITLSVSFDHAGRSQREVPGQATVIFTARGSENGPLSSAGPSVTIIADGTEIDLAGTLQRTSSVSDSPFVSPRKVEVDFFEVKLDLEQAKAIAAAGSVEVRIGNSTLKLTKGQHKSFVNLVKEMNRTEN